MTWARARGEKQTRPVKIRLVIDDRPGVLASLTTAIAAEETNIKTVDGRAGEDSQGTIHLVLDIQDTRHLERILKRLRDVPGIREADRSRSI
ncbi:hypothetical protein DRQ53_14745 [bacterium]|nr:MAG: hypothetical protein DRQ53_14745 [bacterium]